MKNTYPIILTPEDSGYTAYIPDFEINTEGDSLTEVIEMARDAIGLMGIDLEDNKKDLPNVSDYETVAKKLKNSELITLVDVDFSEYRRKNDMRAVKKNCTVPSWLCYEAEKAGINFSQVLQNALKAELKITDR